jgi:hypothetical protein
MTTMMMDTLVGLVDKFARSNLLMRVDHLMLCTRCSMFETQRCDAMPNATPKKQCAQRCVRAGIVKCDKTDDGVGGVYEVSCFLCTQVCGGCFLHVHCRQCGHCASRKSECVRMCGPGQAD